MEGVVGSTTQAPPTTQIPWTTLGIVATPKQHGVTCMVGQKHEGNGL